MPTHEFRRGGRGKVSERIAQGPVEGVPCPASGSEKVLRQMVPFAAPASGPRRGGMADLSSRCCPCNGGRGPSHAR